MGLDLVAGTGIVFILIGLSVLCNSKKYSKKIYSELNNGVCLIFFSGLGALLVGLFLIAQNVPVDLKTWILEVIGWLGILKGLLLLLTPSLAQKFYKILQSRKMFISLGILALLIGLILLF